MCIPLKHYFHPPPDPSTSAQQSSPENHKGVLPYRHIPVVASSSFLRTTTKRDMFELTGSTRAQHPASGKAVAVDSHGDKTITEESALDSSNNPSTQLEI